MVLGLWWMLAACGGEEAEGACPQHLVSDVVACVQDWLADPENTTPAEELVVLCADAEPLADAYDAWCASDDADPALCEVSYEEAWTALSAPCAEQAAIVGGW